MHLPTFGIRTRTKKTIGESGVAADALSPLMNSRFPINNHNAIENSESPAAVDAAMVDVRENPDVLRCVEPGSCAYAHSAHLIIGTPTALITHITFTPRHSVPAYK